MSAIQDPLVKLRPWLARWRIAPVAAFIGLGLASTVSAQTTSQPSNATSGQRPAVGAATTPPLDEAAGQTGGVARPAPPPTGDTTVNKSAPAPKGKARPKLGSTTPPTDEATGEPGGVTRSAPPPSGPQRQTPAAK
jgi:hypothetical protein